jgi:hypothetical protein
MMMMMVVVVVVVVLMFAWQYITVDQFTIF